MLRKPRRSPGPFLTEARDRGRGARARRAGPGGIARLCGGLGPLRDAVGRACRRHRGPEQLGAALGFPPGRVARVE